MRSAVVFDVDGVLVNSPHERAWQETLAELVRGEWSDIAAGTRYGHWLRRLSGLIPRRHRTWLKYHHQARAVFQKRRGTFRYPLDV